MNDILIAKTIKFFKNLGENFAYNADDSSGLSVFLLILFLSLFISSFFWSLNFLTAMLHFTLLIILFFVLILNFKK